ncbi:hypothetical protein [Endozoicomonas sp. SCSIO W0465]|uniref:DUF3024 domain-containing protein n=1 Tax=Endozoicomonas sp. SCSIO W0465 TaxID=2918516 RepID=UPI002075F084|nr:hypothetical protein [Endozoicomonas sp. SCSIO W0465]USE36834.1 hypothetical protein MJO57_00905 [Endozoicomonas sp. SCSIO W0465]
MAEKFMSSYMWMPATKRASKPKVSPETKAVLKAQADRWVEDYLKPAKVEPPPENPNFNYLVDIFTKWHGSFFYFCATYHCPSPNAISPSFERKFAGMNYTGNNTYTLSYLRHNDQWHEVFYKQDVDTCFELIAHDPCFMP